MNNVAGIALFAGSAGPFVLYVVDDGSETMDVGNRGFALNYAQNLCAVIGTAGK